ncbi:hypothetical protein BJ166DRAFT_180486 [Pestalotiopsis sp. NC0098]|nr:hypothetical protein BJ166DRAFT_180486 [Pestalotiopsis sp. NC0098]
MPSIHSIPNEMLFEVYSHLCVKDKASLARCCRDFYATLNPLLYRQVRNCEELVPWAAGNGQRGTLEKLFDAGMTDFATLVFNSSRMRGDKHTPLHIAAQGGHEQVIQLLLDHGADIDAPCTSLG